MSSWSRLLLACALLSVWLLLLFTGWTFGGAVFLFLVGALVAFPWNVFGHRRGS